MKRALIAVMAMGLLMGVSATSDAAHAGFTIARATAPAQIFGGLYSGPYTTYVAQDKWTAAWDQYSDRDVFKDFSLFFVDSIFIKGKEGVHFVGRIYEGGKFRDYDFVANGWDSLAVTNYTWTPGGALFTLVKFDGEKFAGTMRVDALASLAGFYR